MNPADDRMSALLDAARLEPMNGRPNVIQYAPVTKILRAKKWSYRRIFDWLIERGEPLTEANWNTFRTGLARRERREPVITLAAGKEAS